MSVCILLMAPVLPALALAALLFAASAGASSCVSVDSETECIKLRTCRWATNTTCVYASSDAAGSGFDAITVAIIVAAAVGCLVVATALVAALFATERAKVRHADPL